MSGSTSKAQGGASKVRDDNVSQPSGPLPDQEEEFHCGMGDEYAFFAGSDEDDFDLNFWFSKRKGNIFKASTLY